MSAIQDVPAQNEPLCQFCRQELLAGHEAVCLEYNTYVSKTLDCRYCGEKIVL